MEYEYKNSEKLKLKKIELGKTQDFHKILCPSCENEVNASDLNINDKIAKCGECNGIFSFQNTVNQLVTNPEKVKQDIVKPEGIGQFNFKDELSFAIQQPYSGLGLGLGVMGFSLAILSTFAALGTPNLFVISAAFLFWMVSAYGIYHWKTYSKNKIYLTVKRDLLTVCLESLYAYTSMKF